MAPEEKTPEGTEPEAEVQPEESAEQTPPEEALAQDAATESEEPQAEAPAAEVQADESAEQTPPEEPAEQIPPEEALAQDAAAESEEPQDAAPPPAEEPAQAEDKPAEKPKGDSLPPGADLEPIAVEPVAELSAEEAARIEAEKEERARREAVIEDEGDGEESEAAPSRAPAKMESGARYSATGKRKRSIARVILTPGDGRIEINERSLEEYFPRPLHQSMARQPLASTGYEGNVDVLVRVRGGGISGQAGAVRHGIARALTEVDAELRGDLKRRGFLRRDARVKERRKAGLKKARKRPQFSKR